MKKDSADGRRLMWKIAGRAIAENPWGGCGLGYFGGAFGKAQAAYFATEEATEQEEWVAGSPEYGFNEYLQLGWNWGLSGVSFSYWLSGWQSGNCSILPAPRKERCWEG